MLNKAKPPRPKQRTALADLSSLLLGWIFIIVVLFGIVVMVLRAKPEGKLVCDTNRRTASLTQFGSCRTE